jgi:hypothetical protein
LNRYRNTRTGKTGHAKETRGVEVWTIAFARPAVVSYLAPIYGDLLDYAGYSSALERDRS